MMKKMLINNILNERQPEDVWNYFYRRKKKWKTNVYGKWKLQCRVNKKADK